MGGTVGSPVEFQFIVNASPSWPSWSPDVYCNRSAPWMNSEGVTVKRTVS